MGDDAGISKPQAAQRQLDCAIRLYFVDEDSIAVHSLAYHAYRLLRELLEGDEHAVMKQLEKELELGKVANFSKHVQGDPDAILEEHSLKAVHLTIFIAIKLWERLGQTQTEEMQAFSTLDHPYLPGHRASYTIDVMRQEGPITEEQREWIINAPSSGGPAIIPGKRKIPGKPSTDID